jgi:hypothetical protein
MANDLFRQNSFKVVGTLIKADQSLKTNPDNGEQSIAVTATVSSVIEGKTNEFTIKLFSKALTVEGKPNGLYASYSKMNELEGHKVEISGSISENRYYSTTGEQMVSAQVLNGRWVKAVPEATADEATYTLGGFIIKGVTDKVNKSNEIYRYDVAIAQSNYNGDNISVFNLNIDPSNIEVLNGVKGYNIGDTVKLVGDLSSVVETKTVEDSTAGFGKKVYNTFTNTYRGYYITFGSSAIQDETTYDSVTIQRLVAAYKAKDAELMAKAKSGVVASAPANNNPEPVTQRQVNLI